MGSFCNYFFEEMVTQVVLTNTDAGIASGSVASAILIGETIDLFSSTVLNCFLHMPHGFVSSDRSLTSPTPLTLRAWNRVLYFFFASNSFHSVTSRCNLTDATLSSVIFVHSTLSRL